MGLAEKWKEFRERLRLEKPRLSEYKISQLQRAFYAGAEAAIDEPGNSYEQRAEIDHFRSHK